MLNGLGEGAHDGLAGDVSTVKNSAVGVSAFFSEVVFGFFSFSEVEFEAEFFEGFDTVLAVLDDLLRDGGL